MAKRNDNPHRRPGWKYTMARRALSAIHKKQIQCSICADIGFIIDPTQIPASIPCPNCQKRAFEYREDEMFPFVRDRQMMTD